MMELGFDYITPPQKFVGVNFNPDELLAAIKVIANLRIHVERAMRRFKEFRIVSGGAFPIPICDLMGKIVNIYGKLSNLQSPLTTTSKESRL